MQRLIEFEIKKHPWSPQGSEYGHVSDIHIRNVVADYPFINKYQSHILGHSEDHMIENITLENITIAGKPVRYFNDIPVLVNEFTKKISIIP